jgi:threonylcarbamoyladenosine tRNA methylthiotransferase MtaB
VGFEEMKITRAPRTRAYVKIEDGCESRCSYCAIRLARGPVRSKPMAAVIAEVEGLYASGTREVVLTGIETGSYGKDLGEGVDLAELILELDRRHSCDRLRLGSLAPELVGESFIKRVAGAKILAPHFHLSVQSGSNRVLRAMRRRYSREGALRTIELFREYIPKAQFTTDLMVGFPGESEEDFLDTVDFARRARFLDAHVFAYSKREGTDAASMKGQVDSATKKERSRGLIEVCHGVRDGVLDEIVARVEPLSVILETERKGVFSSHSAEFCEVELEARGYSQGDMVRVIPVSHEKGIIKGRLAD